MLAVVLLRRVPGLAARLASPAPAAVPAEVGLRMCWDPLCQDQCDHTDRDRL